MATVREILDKIEKLESLCPGIHISRNNLELLADDGLSHLMTIHITGPAAHGGIRDFSVNLADLGWSASQWLDDSIAKYLPTDHDDRYNVICSVHGQVQIGSAGYMSQLSLPDSPWRCPLCGRLAEFDQETYEASLEEEMIE